MNLPDMEKPTNDDGSRSKVAISYRPQDQKREQCYHDARGREYFIDQNGTEHRYQIIDGKIAVPLKRARKSKKQRLRERRAARR